ncbi:MAG: DUF1080 domain-containing protein [Gemmataceae bacterium]
MMRLTRRAMALAALCMLAGLTNAQDKVEEGFTSLFNGKDLTGWTVENKGKFSVKDGAIFQDGGSGWLRSDKKFKDFELRMDFRFVKKGSDGGIFLRASADGKNWPAKAYQVQNMDNGSLGSIFPAGFKGPKQKKDGAKQKEVQKQAGDWQSYVITAKGPKLEVSLNGQVINVVDGLEDIDGHIGIQGEGGQIEFKNIRIKELK